MKSIVVGLCLITAIALCIPKHTDIAVAVLIATALYVGVLSPKES